MKILQGEETFAQSPRAARWTVPMRALLRHVLDVALPPLCPACRAPLGDGAGLLADCWAKLSFIEPPFCARLGIPFTYHPGPGLLSMEAIANARAHDRTHAAVRYDEIARALVLSFKYGDRLDLAPMLGRWMARAGSKFIQDADALVPVHWPRLWSRRFNHSAALAGSVGRQCGLPVLYDALKRVRATPQQVGLSKPQRADNVQGAFYMCRPTTRRSSPGGGSSWWMTCSPPAPRSMPVRALLRPGAAHVDVLVFARVVAPVRSPI